MKRLVLFVSALLAFAACRGPLNGDYDLRILTTNDIHGCYFDSTYVDSSLKKSLLAVNYYVDSVRSAAGKDNVILLDAGDFLQGDNAAYYFNYVDTLTPHVFPRMVRYMDYDAVAMGNHDIETGHPVYDRIKAQFKEYKIPLLAGNAIRNDNGKPYFQTYTTLRKGGLKVAVLGYENPNINAWLDESLWSGMSFVSLIPLVQEDVDKVRAKEKPQVVIVMVHSGVGNGDGSVYESQGLDLYNSLTGVDFLICSHDHSAAVFENDDICLIDSGSHARNVGYGEIKLSYRKGELVSRELSASLIPVRWEKADPEMKKAFQKDYEAVKAFTLREVGTLENDLWTRDAYRGMCDYINLVHTVSIACAPAQVSFAAPLTYNGRVKAGTLVFNDLFTIYPFENQLFVVSMSGKEIKDYLEYSYARWIRTVSSPDDHVLNMAPRGDLRTGQQGWSFVGRSYNFDSAAGLVYTVDITKPAGERVNIISMADGAPFEEDGVYPVAMTSYRASGGGDLMREGACIDTDRIDERVVARYPEIRNLIYDYLLKEGAIESAKIGDKSVIGEWRFVPEDLARKCLDRDMTLMFGRP